MTLPQQARALATLLGESAALWRPAPFQDDPSWVHALPALAGSVLSVPDARLAALEEDPDLLAEFLGPQLAAVADADRLCRQLVTGTTAPPLVAPETAGRDVPGRKWRQALHFAAACQPAEHSQALVDWCCGKAHLGRLLARTLARPVTGIEHDAALCTEGNRLAQRDHLAVRISQADALTVSAVDASLLPGTHAVALHACGDLHLALLHVGSAAAIDGFTIAPCCYHRTRQAHWQPLSAALAGTPLATLGLRPAELRMAVHETVTATPRVARQARQLAAWRLGFDRLQRDLRGTDSYLPTPSRPARILADGFTAFCADMAAHHGLVLPAGTGLAHYEAQGVARQARVRRLELLRHAFRRPLETALVADRALFLAERGYQVDIRVFCPRQLTPRNLAIVAQRN